MILTIVALAAATPSPEAVALGERLARAGTLATLLPMIAQGEADGLAKAHPELTEAERARLRVLATEAADRGGARIAAAMGRGYAERLSVADLRTLVAAAESPAQRRFRAALPAVMAQAMAGGASGSGGFDLKQDIRAAFCRDTGKLCEAK